MNLIKKIQKCCSKGSKTYYVISQPYCQVGLFALWKHVASHILWAKEQGYIPVIDLQHTRNQFFKDGCEYRENPWDYYFEQPEKIKIKDLNKINKSSIIKIAPLSVWADKKYEIYPSEHLPLSKNDNRHHPLAREYSNVLKFNKDIIKAFTKIKKNTFPEGKKILGVLLRGTDYTALCPAGHPIQPTTSEVIAKCKELKSVLKYDKIYLATEDQEIYNEFKNEFGKNLIDNIQYKYENTGSKYLQSVQVNRKNHFYELNKEYACSMYLLSQCNYLVGGLCNGTQTAYFMTNCFDNYDYVHLWNKGVYTRNDTIRAQNEVLKKTPIKDNISVTKSNNDIVKKLQYNHWYEKIFSIKNLKYTSKRFKVLTFAGIRIKFKSIINKKINDSKYKFFDIYQEKKHRVIKIGGLKLKYKHNLPKEFAWKKWEKAIRKYKYVHLMNNGLHSVNIIHFINKYFNNSEHCFLFPCAMFDSTKQKLKGVKNVYYSSLKNIKINKVNKIIIHGIFDDLLVKRLYKNKHLLKKTYWFIWGGDLYSAKNTIPHNYIRKNIAGILTSFDKEIYEKKYGKPHSYFDVTYPHDITEDMVSQRKYDNGIHIQINNSADETTLEMLDILSKFKDENIKITTILSYISSGHKDLRVEIMKKGFETFGSKFNPITEFMPKEQYVNHLASVDIYISNQNRQQGNGNMTFIHSLGGKCFLKSDTSVYKKYNSIGMKIFDTYKISQMNFNEFCAYNEDDKKISVSILKERMKDETKVKQWEKFFND